MPRGKEFGYADYQKVFLSDVYKLTSELGIDVGSIQTVSTPPTEPFVLGVDSKEYSKRGTPGRGKAFVTKVIFGSLNPNLGSAPSNETPKNGKFNKPHVIYHDYDGKGKTHWNYPYTDSDGKTKYLFVPTSVEPNAIVEYLSGIEEIHTRLESRRQGQREEQQRLNFRRDMEKLKTKGTVVDSITSAAKRLYFQAGVELLDMKYKAKYNGGSGVEEVQFSIKGVPMNKKGKRLVFVPSGSKTQGVEDCGWFIINDGGIRKKIDPSRASKFLATLI